jgi:hypothetical protein
MVYIHGLAMFTKSSQKSNTKISGSKYLYIGRIGVGREGIRWCQKANPSFAEDVNNNVWN